MIQNGTSNNWETSGIYAYLLSVGHLDVIANTFQNLRYSGIKIECAPFLGGTSTIAVHRNNFFTLSTTALVMNYIGYTATSVEGNEFSYISCSACPSAISIILNRDNAFNLVPNATSLSLNKFTQNQGNCVVYVHLFPVAVTPSTSFSYLSFTANTLINNQPTDSVLYNEYYLLNVTANVFSNPSAPYEFKVGFTGNLKENCTLNWWRSTNASEISRRIYDQNDLTTLGLVLFEPFLNTTELSCSTVNGCSQHGTCILPEVCRCDSGWEGNDCNTVSCSLVNDCSGRGNCTGPNICQCGDGWLSPNCNTPSCVQRNNCNNHGTCASPNVCQCSGRYTGDSCSGCVAGYWGSYCLPCPNCVHGKCHNETGKCVCDGLNWVGDSCDQCAPTFSGLWCEALPTLVYISPSGGSDLGGTVLHVHGYHFPNTTTYRCRFDQLIVNGSWLSDTEVICICPAHTAGTVSLQISPAPMTDFFVSEMSFLYYPTCLATACGALATPARGYCSIGRCQCFTPWMGENCDVLGLAPSLVPVSSQVLYEGQYMDLTINISQGTPPFSWSTISLPSGVVLNSQIGRIQWISAVANSNPYNFVVACVNSVGSSVINFTVSVPPAYSVLLDPVSPGPFVYPPYFIIRGRIFWVTVNNKEYFIGKPVSVNILINSSSSFLTLQTIASIDTSTFSIRYTSPQSDVGQFQLDARHPADSGFETQYSWTVYGLELQVRPTLLDGYIGTYTYPSFITVTNTGVDPLTVVRLAQVTFPFDLQLSSNISTGYQCTLNLTSCQLATALRPGEYVTIDATVHVNAPRAGWFALTALTYEGVSRSDTVTYNFRPKLPVLTLSPSSVYATIARGMAYYYQINVTNDGLERATNVTAHLPADNIVSLVSLGKYGSSSLEEILILETGETALLSLSFMADEQSALGEHSGYLTVTSLETSVLLSCRIVITSTNRLNLTVAVEDEYTYFSDDHPLLSGAKITLKSHFLLETMTLVTNTSGSVVFTDVREDYYDLWTSADKHQPDSRVIFATAVNGSTGTVRIFLQRTAVTYSWSVTPTSYQDEYDVSLEADFETYVPIPVVTIFPNKLDLKELESGSTPSVDFEITNHGLIAAKQFTFTLPADDHPFMHLHMDKLMIGDIPANSTVYVSMKVNVNESEKLSYLNKSSQSLTRRGFTDWNCGLFIDAVFEYVCDTKHYVHISISISADIWCVVRGGSFSGGYGDVAAGDWKWNVQGSITSPLTCDKLDNCVLGPLTCLEMIHDLVKCFNFLKTLTLEALKESAVEYGSDTQTWKNIAKGAGELAAGNYFAAWNTAKDVLRGLLKALCEDCYSAVENGITCYEKLKKCYELSHSSSRRRRSVSLSRHDMLPEMIRRTLSTFQFVRLVTVLPGDSNWYYIPNRIDWWHSTLQPVLSDDSDSGRLISMSEYSSVLQKPLPGNATVVMVETLLQRINNTFSGVPGGQNNSIDLANLLTIGNSLLTDTQHAAADAGFHSLVEWFEDGYNSFLLAEEDKNEGVCAKVRIQILQKVTLTRSAFNARLEVDNGEANALTNIRVVIDIRHLNGTLAGHKFAVGEPELSGISDINGTGQLAVGTKGSAEWLIVPYSAAAPTVDTQYNIGGTLYYSVNGDELTVPLFPDTVTVKPDPRLYLNYFLEKYVYAGDPQAHLEVFRTSIPFCLGILVTNDGYGVASDLGITSAQPVIIDNEKGLLVKFQITGAELGNTGIMPSLTVKFGDIQPHSTKMARWIMTSSLSGVFSNYSATFTNRNPLGDPKLSVLDSVLYHELMHVIKVDYPVDDGIADFLTVNQHAIDYLPDKIYLSNDGISPLSVRVGNVTNISYVSINRIQVTVHSSSSAWVYFRGLYNLPSSSSTLYSVSRSDGRVVIPDFNVWFSLINKNTFLNLVDYIPSANSTFQYNIAFSGSISSKPKFNSSTYQLNITEETTYVGDVLSVMAVSGDPEALPLTYSLFSSSGLPFSLDSVSGQLSLTSVLDREEHSAYSLLVQAVDQAIPPQTGTAIIVVSVIDINDNPPIFGHVPSDISIEEKFPIGNVVATVSATDADDGDNGVVLLTLSDASGLLILDTSGDIKVNKSLQDHKGIYNVTVVARDLGIPPMYSLLTFNLHVVNNNLFPPLYLNVSYLFEVSETDDTNLSVGQMLAVDPDNTSEIITYSIGSIVPCSGSFPFTVDQTMGVIRNILPLSCLTCSRYLFTVIATDNGAPPTGPLNVSANVTIVVNAVNRFDPQFDQSSYEVHITENAPVVTTLLSLKASDRDSGMNGNVTTYTLIQTGNNFRLDTILGTAQILSTKPLNRSVQAQHLLQVIAIDGGQPSRNGSTTVAVIVDASVDKAPRFFNDSAVIAIPRRTPVNSVIFTVQAVSADTSAILVYSLVSYSSASQYIDCNSYTGKLSLKTTLVGTNVTVITVSVMVSVGTLTSRTAFNLTVYVNDDNIFPPVFDARQYFATINESAPIGTVVLQFTAKDNDSPLLLYVIQGGDVDSRFKLDLLTGVLKVFAPLDREMHNSYNLTVLVYDETGGESNALNDTAVVYITVTDTNEFDPVFYDAPTIQIHLQNGSAVHHIWQVRATDGDGQIITYRLLDVNETKFSVEPVTGWFNVLTPLSTVTQSPYMIQVVATDNGVPNRSSVLDVIVVLDYLAASTLSPTPPGMPETIKTTAVTITSDVVKAKPRRIRIKPGSSRRGIKNRVLVAVYASPKLKSLYAVIKKPSRPRPGSSRSRPRPGLARPRP